MDTLTGAILVFVVSAVFVVFAGVGLARFGDELAEKTGWGTLWVGTLLVSIATSLPELTVSISAVWLEDSPGLALGNVFGADMINVFVLGVAALAFGVRNLFENQGRDTQILILLGIGMVVLAVVMGALGDVKLGPTSLGGLLLIAAYVAGMRAVYKSGRTEMHAADIPSPKGSARNAWIGFGISVAVVIVAGRFLAASADSIAEIPDRMGRPTRIWRSNRPLRITAGSTRSASLVAATSTTPSVAERASSRVRSPVTMPMIYPLVDCALL